MDHILFKNKFSTPIGELIIITDKEEKLYAVDWEDYDERVLTLLKRYHNQEAPYQFYEKSLPKIYQDAFSRYFEKDFSLIHKLPVFIKGTDFQRKAWNTLLTIPVGTTLSYQEQAYKMGNIKAVRAVGMANGSNPIGIVIPCHRVIGSNKSLTGYAGGLHRKLWLLQHEGVSLKKVHSNQETLSF